jgi:type III secretory pathway component EscV
MALHKRADSMLLSLLNIIVPEVNNTPQIMLLLHMQIRRYFNNICDNNNICYTLCEYRTTDYWVDDILVGW